MSSSKPHHESDPRCVEFKRDEKRWIFKPRGLNIVWGNDPRYWRIPEENDADKPAELKQVSWLEVTGLVELNGLLDLPGLVERTGSDYDLSRRLNGSKYRIEFRVSLTKDMSGWNSAPLFLMAKVGRKGKYSWKKIKTQSFSNIRPNEPIQIPGPDDPFEITVQNTRDFNIYFGLYEVWSGKWKKGLLIHEASVEGVNINLA